MAAETVQPGENRRRPAADADADERQTAEGLLSSVQVRVMCVSVDPVDDATTQVHVVLGPTGGPANGPGESMSLALVTSDAASVFVARLLDACKFVFPDFDPLPHMVAAEAARDLTRMLGDPRADASSVDLIREVKREVTEEWVELFERDRAAGKNFAESIFWRLSAETLPAGVDAADPRVVAALDVIREAMLDAAGRVAGDEGRSRPPLQMPGEPSVN